MNKILVIDDEKNIQVSLASILEDEGYKVFIADNGEDGLEKFKNVKPDAVFLDIWLPGMDGLETMRKMLAGNPLQIIIMISGHGNITTAVSAVKEGAYDFLEKPLGLDKVIFVLKRGLEYQKLLDEINVNVSDEETFKILESCLISDDTDLIRAIAASLIQKCYPKRGLRPLVWSIQNLLQLLFLK